MSIVKSDQYKKKHIPRYTFGLLLYEIKQKFLVLTDKNMCVYVCVDLWVFPLNRVEYRLYNQILDIYYTHLRLIRLGLESLLLMNTAPGISSQIASRQLMSVFGV